MYSDILYTKHLIIVPRDKKQISNVALSNL